ncbi:hypothetical protein OHC33_008818 [Knufia fluminis]|uniref:Uncharacterized protein n=1 Tax=Knufia fluminis TaxID=191047 RepID=A0AAN8EAI3_9EURO|nr:hypothetical protein OHC33_008818 [Knufia fluminis]
MSTSPSLKSQLIDGWLNSVPARDPAEIQYEDTLSKPECPSHTVLQTTKRKSSAAHEDTDRQRRVRQDGAATLSGAGSMGLVEAHPTLNQPHDPPPHSPTLLTPRSARFTRRQQELAIENSRPHLHFFTAEQSSLWKNSTDVAKFPLLKELWDSLATPPTRIDPSPYETLSLD